MSRIDWSHALAVAEPPSAEEPKDFAVRVRVRNGRLLTAIRRAGFASVAAFCQRHGFHYEHTIGYVTLRRSPLSTRTGLPTQGAQRLADALGALVEDLFPPRQMAAAMAAVRRPVDLALTDEQIEHFLYQLPVTPEQYLQLADAQRDIRRALGTLSPRQERVMRMRLGYHDDTKPEMSMIEVADALRISRARAHQIEGQALRSLQNPKKAWRLSDAAETLGVGFSALHRRRPPPPPPEEAPEAAAARLAAAKAARYAEDLAMAHLADAALLAPARAKSPPAEQQKVARPRKFPDQRPPRPAPSAVLHECSPDVIRLLRIPPESRTDAVKRAIAYHLEQEFGARGAGTLNVNVEDPTPERVALRKYDYLMLNLHWLWDMFPPAPVLEVASAGP